MAFGKKGFSPFKVGKKLPAEDVVEVAMVLREAGDATEPIQGPRGAAERSAGDRRDPPDGKSSPGASHGDEPTESKHQQALRMAREGVPKTRGSSGAEYYVGPTPGQVISWWFGDNPHVSKRLHDMMADGATDDQVLEALRGESKELTEQHVRWARGVHERDLGRRAEYLRRTTLGKNDDGQER